MTASHCRWLPRWLPRSPPLLLANTHTETAPAPSPHTHPQKTTVSEPQVDSSFSNLLGDHHPPGERDQALQDALMGS